MKTQKNTIGERIFQEVLLSQIKINPLNPRKIFSGPKYDELLASVKRKGVLAPVLLRPILEKNERWDAFTSLSLYEIIAGERRYRVSCDIAKENGGMEGRKIPAIIQAMSDDEAFDIMTIENLQRADITPLEEARAYKLYLDKRGPEALPDLAGRLGLDPRYIRRRTAVLDLPDNILKSWEDGEVSHGHLEQLTRVKDPKELDDFFEDVLRQGMSVTYLKGRIESRAPNLSTAFFNTHAVGCLTCQANTTVQRNLFGEDVASKALCTRPECFKEKQGEGILANWEKFKSSREIKTNGFRFSDDVPWEVRSYIYDKTKKKCETCECYQSLISLSGSVDQKKFCIGPKKCFDELYYPERSAGKKSGKEADPDAPRVAWHGEYFREEFYKTRLPELVNALPDDDEKILRILLLTILETHNGAWEAFEQKYINSTDEYVNFCVPEAWARIERLDSGVLKSILHELSLLILMDCHTTRPHTRRPIAVHLGSDLAAEWRITQEYLDKKTTQEIHAIAEQFGIFKDDLARNYLFEKLGKKRDRFDLCKKGELVKVILESGVDLAGKVPDEILQP
jgi:ParB/RepB/Spo0J family partition protein